MPLATPAREAGEHARHGARVVLHGDNLSESGDKAGEIAAADGLVLVHPYDDPAIMAGQGTVALEMLADAPDLDAIVVPIGGGGLISGIAVAAKALKPAWRSSGSRPRSTPRSTTPSTASTARSAGRRSPRASP
jgi:threonine dehydratase